MGSITNSIGGKFLMDAFVEKICDVFRPYSSFGLIKQEDKDKVAQIVNQIRREEALMAKEYSYNEGFVTGVRSAQRGNVN
jgi:hypothetical protein